MIEAIMLGIIGIPVFLCAIGIWMCCAIALLDAIGAYAGGRRVEKIMERANDEIHARANRVHHN